MHGHVELGDPPAQAVVDEALREFQAEVSPQGSKGGHRDSGRDVEAVLEDAVEDGGADEVVVVGFGRDIQRPGAKGLAAGTPGLVLGVVDIEPSLLPVGERADTTKEGAFTTTALAAMGAGVGLGGAADDADFWHEHDLCSWEVRR
jgi:hypothetical protein